jgi:small-conductance mechanosensitive channel
MEQRINQKLEKIMSEQSQQQTDIDNATTAITGLLADMQADIAAIGTGVTNIQNLLAADGPVDTTALDTEVANIAQAQASLDAAAASVTNVVPPATS